MKKLIIPIILIISTILIVTFEQIAFVEEKGFTSHVSFQAILFSGGLFGIGIMIISIVLWIWSIKKQNLLILQCHSIFIFAWAYISTLFIWSSEPQGKIDYRFTGAWNLSFIVVSMILVNTILYLVIANKNKV
jgi:hypothetical protein